MIVMKMLYLRICRVYDTNDRLARKETDRQERLKLLRLKAVQGELAGGPPSASGTDKKKSLFAHPIYFACRAFRF
jgi:hypothetical protein